MLPAASSKWASTECQQFLALHLEQVMFRLVSHIQLWDIGSLYWQKQQWHAPCGILKMSVNGASTIFSFASCVSYIPIGWGHPFMRYWQPLLAKTTATCSLRHPENEHQQSVNSFRACIFRNQGLAWNISCITVLLTASLGKNTIYRRWNTNTKLIDITSFSISKSTLLVAVNTILIRYYWQLANLRSLYESIDGPAGRPADNPPNSDGLGVYHGTVPECAVRVYWRPGPPIWQRFGLHPDPDPKWRSGTVANTSLGAPWITVEQSGKNNIFFGNAAGAPGNHSYCIQFVFSSMYLCIYVSI